MLLSDADTTLILETVRDAARREIMPRFRALSEADINTKSAPDDLVTAADLAAEALITAQLGRAFPDALILGEEAVAADPNLRDQLADAEMAIIIDPVDGTWNYARGLALFGVILAVTRYGIPVYGLLYDPVIDDWIVSQEHAVTCYTNARNSRALRLPATPPETKAGGYVPLGSLPDPHRLRVAALWPEIGRLNSLRCACHEFRMLAQGHVDFMLSTRLTLWDHAAGCWWCNRPVALRKCLTAAPTQLSGATVICSARAAPTHGPKSSRHFRSCWTDARAYSAASA